MFGRSFNDIGTAIVGKINYIKKAFQATDDLVGSVKDSNSIWKRLYPSKESIESQLIDIDFLYPDISDTTASNLLTKLQKEQVLVDANKQSWQNYFNSLSEGEKWQIDFVQNTDLQKASLTDIKKTYDSARASALAHNEAIKAQTFSAKAGKVALTALATAGNMLAMLAIVKGIELAARGIDNLAHASEHCAKRANTLMSSYQTALDTANSHRESIENIADRYETLSRGVNNLGENISLTTEEYEEYNSIVNEIAEMFPTMTQGYTDEGNAILKLKGNVDALRDAYKSEAQAAYQSLVTTGKDTDGNDILKNANNIITKSALGVHDQGNVEKIKYLDKLMNASDSVDGMLDLWTESYNNGYSTWYEDFSDVSGTVKIKKLSEEDLANIRKNAKILKQQYQAEIDSAVDDVETLANAYLMTNEDYAKLDEQSQKAASVIVNSLDADIVSGFGKNKENVGKYVNDIVQTFLGNPEAQNALVGLFTLDASDLQPDKAKELIDRYIDTLATSLEENPVELKARLGFEGADDLAARYQNSADKFGIQHRLRMRDFFEDNSINTVEELDYFDKVTEGAKNAFDAMEMYNSVTSSDLSSPITSSIEQISSLLEPQFSKLGEAYRNIFTEDGFTTENIDSSMLEGLRETFAQMENASAFDADALESFFAVLTSGASDAQQMQKAFDDLASSYLDSTGILENLSEANADAVKTQLEALGVSNAQEVVNASLMQSEDALANAQEEVTRLKGEDYAASIDLENATAGELQALYNEANMCGLASGGLASLLAQKYNVNSLSIASAADCNALAQIYAWSETAAASLKNLAAAKQRAENGQYVPEEELKGKEKLANAEVEKAKATPNINTNPTVKTPAVNKGGGSPSKTTFSEVFDWLELRIKRLQSNFDKWINRAETALTSNRIEKYYNKAARQLENIMRTNSKAYNRYLKKADDVKLSKEYKRKVQNGEISSETLKGKAGEKLAEQIKKYQEYWEKAQEYLDAYVEQAEKLANIPLDKAAAKIERFNKTIELIDAKIENVKVDNYENANTLIDKEEKEQKKILKANQNAQKATKANLKKAKKTLSKDKYLNSDDGITDDEKKQIKKDLKEGKEVNLSYFKEGSAGYKSAVKYNEALKKNDEAKQETNLAKEAFNKWQQEAANQKFDNIRTYYNAKIAQLDAQNDLIQNEIDRIEAKGMAVTARYYQEQIDAENKKLEKYQKEKEQLEGQLQATEALGLKGTQVWYDMKEAIAELDAAIVQSDTDIAKLNKSITTLADESFKKMLSINQARSEATDWAVGLMESKDSFDDENAAFTKEGIARLYSYVSGYQSSKENAADYQMLLDNLKSNYKQGTLSFTDVFGNLRTYNSMNEFKDSIDALYEGWREQISETNAYESKSIELIQEKLQKEISAMQELIDAKKAALSAEKNLHDYQKSIRTATDNIAALEKQIISIQGDTSEEGISRIQKLQKELADAQEDLSEKEYDKYISDQQSMLDNLQQEYSDLITSEMKQIEHLLENALSIMTSMETSLGAEGTIAQYLDKYDYKTNNTTAPSADTAESGNQSGSATSTSGNPAAFPAHSRAMGSSTGTVNYGSIPVPAAASHEAASQNNRLTAVESVSFQTDDKKSLKEKALAYIRNRAGAPTKKKGEYSDVNKKIWEITDGKVLSTAKLKELAEIVGVAFDTAKSSGSLYKKLKAIGVQGFKHGGIGKLVKEQGEDGIAIVKNGEGFISPEDVDKIGSLVGSVPVLDNLSKNLIQLPSFDNTTAISNTSNTIEMQISLPGVQNYQEFATALQRDPRFEKFIKAISIDELSIQGNNNRLSKNKIHF